MSSLQLSHSSQPYAQMPSPSKLIKFMPSPYPLTDSKSLQSHHNSISTSMAPLPNHFKLSLAETGDNSIHQTPTKKLVTFRPYSKRGETNIFKKILFNTFWAIKEFLKTVFLTILFGGISLIIISIYQLLKAFVKGTTNIFWTVIFNILSLFPGKSLPVRFWSLKKTLKTLNQKKLNQEIGHDRFTKPKYQRSEPKTNKPLTLVLDLDETLIHSTRTMPIHGGYDTLKIQKIDGEYQQIYLRKRPYLHDFLEKVSLEFNIIVFTASRQEYADVILDFLDRKNIISKRFYRESCIRSTTGFLKDLTLIEPTLGKIILLDNSIVAGALQPENYLPIKSWFHDETDQALQYYANFLVECAKKWKADILPVKDIRRHLKDTLSLGKHHIPINKLPAN